MGVILGGKGRRPPPCGDFQRRSTAGVWQRYGGRWCYRGRGGGTRKRGYVSEFVKCIITLLFKSLNHSGPLNWDDGRFRLPNAKMASFGMVLNRTGWGFKLGRSEVVLLGLIDFGPNLVSN